MNVYPDANSAAAPSVSTEWSAEDILGAIMVRCNLRRNNYRVSPGLYRVGAPGPGSEVFVSANYKLSFDILRKSLSGLDAWILVLDTRGINVWCAAGKGTFGTGELVDRINRVALQNVVSHRKVILPQLGAPGVSAAAVKEQTGFTVRFGPVRAGDIKPWIDNGQRKTEAMRAVSFSFADRLILTPVEIVAFFMKFLPVMALFVILSGITSSGFSFEAMVGDGLYTSLFLLASYLSGAFLTPILLPWIPSRYFSAKGIIMAITVLLAMAVLSGTGKGILYLSGIISTGAAVSSFLAMNFTGASTYTSLSGVRKEMKIFVPVQAVLAIAGLALMTVSRIFFT